MQDILKQTIQNKWNEYTTGVLCIFYGIKLTTCDEKQQWVCETIGICSISQRS